MDDEIPPYTETNFSEFLEVVREILKHLHNFAYLQNSSIVKDFSEKMSETLDMMYLHDQIIGAIESLNPGPSTNFREPKARIFNLLQLHYVEKLLIQHAADELALSLRQAHRDLRQGEEAIARLLWDRLKLADRAKPEQEMTVPREDAFVYIDSQNESVDVIVLLKRAFQTVEQLAQSLSLQLVFSLGVSKFTISTSPPLAQQALISIFSQVVRYSSTSRLDIMANVEQDRLDVQFEYDVTERTPTEHFEFDHIVMNLIKRLQWDFSHSNRPGKEILTVHISRASASILVIDDNEGLVSLISRYLSTYRCSVTGVTDGRQGIELAQTLDPDVIVLDIMMPTIDGWEILQTIRTIPAIANKPVLVCSVFNEPELAYALGASLFLPKPINQQSITHALKQLNII